MAIPPPPIYQPMTTEAGTIDPIWLSWQKDVRDNIDDAATLVDSPTVDNYASLDANGNIQDSGTDSASFVTVTGSQGVTGDLEITGELDVGSVVTTGEVSVGNLLQSGLLQFKANSPAQITANQNNYVPPQAAALRMSSDASRDITGFDDGVDGRILIIFNVGAQNIVLKHQDANSLAVNRILANTGADITLGAEEIGFLWYDSTTARWRATEL